MLRPVADAALRLETGMTMARDGWNAEVYDAKFGYVSALAGGVTELLAPQPGETVLDLGCGTGELAEQLHERGCEVVPVDSDPAMVDAATRRLGFRVSLADGHNFTVGEPVDAVFSNAALHWMTRPAEVIASVRAALRPGGRFVAEMGGSGNVATVIGSLDAALTEHGFAEDLRLPWYFPEPEEYRALLEEHGFQVTSMQHFARPTPLADDAGGIIGWLRMFASALVAHVPAEQICTVLERTAELAAPILFSGGIWHLDYHRLRFAAVAPSCTSSARRRGARSAHLPAKRRERARGWAGAEPNRIAQASVDGSSVVP